MPIIYDNIILVIAMNINDINPYLRFAQSQPSVFEGGCLRRAYDCRIFYALNGEGILHVGDEAIKFGAGNVAFMPFDFPYYFEGKIYIIVLNFDFTRDFCHLKSPAIPVTQEEFCRDKIHNTALPEEFSKPIILKSYRDAEAIISEILQEYRFPQDLSQVKCSGLLKTLLCEILRFSKSPDDKHSIEKQLMGFIKDNCTENLTNEKIAEHFGYNPIYLNRIFKAYCGLSLHKYMMTERLKLSEKLLLGTDLSVDEIAEKCGFSERSRFCTSFKATHGKTPLEYRKNIL